MAPPVGYLTIATTPWARISVDGTDWGTTPLFKRSLPAGPHTLVITNSAENIDARVTAQIVARETVKMKLRCAAQTCSPEPDL